jgi:hypothetical protein
VPGKTETEAVIVRVNHAAGERFIDNVLARQLVDWIAGNSTEETRDQVRKELKDVARELAGPSPTPAEMILCEAAAVSWLMLKTLEARYASLMKPGSGMQIPASEHHQRRIDRTHRRLMSSIKTLALVRRAAAPGVQVNVVQQNRIDQAGSSQVITGGGSATPIDRIRNGVSDAADTTS